MLRFFVFPILLFSCLAHGQGPATFAKDIKPLLEKYCWDCHGDGADKGDLNLDAFTDEASIRKQAKVWQSVHFNVDNWMMPPPKKEQPSAEERQLMTSWLDNLLNPFDPNKPDPGRVTIRRLNRVEYNNTIRDLLGIFTQPANDFPEDDTGYGFDTIGDVLAVPPILMERYLSAADKVLDAAFHAKPPTSQKFQFAAVAFTGAGRREGRDGKQEHWTVTDNGGMGVKHFFPASGTYRLRAKAYGDQAGDEPVKIEFAIDGKPVKVRDVVADSHDKAETVYADAEIEAGSRRFTVKFINDYYDEKAPQGKQDRNMHVIRLAIEGPEKVRADDPSNGGMARFILAPIDRKGETEEAAREILFAFANRGFRRPTQTAEIDRLLRIYKFSRENGQGFKDALVNAMKAVLVSPYFLYRMEWQAEPNNPQQVVELSEMALASRLSYFLWSSMPDDELFKLANAKQLRANLLPTVQRMLKDPKARAFVQNFGGQWLETRTLEVVQPHQKMYRFPGLLRDAMRRETEEFFWGLIQENRSVLEFINADYTYANDALARHYGIPGINGEEFRKVSFPSHVQRRGILTHGSVLTVTSDPTRTSPVKRGKWIMENILGIPAPPPPPNVPTLDDDEGHKSGAGQTIRQKLEAHRSKPGCASCHALIDPLGFGLENFDPVGAHRRNDNGQAIDSTGVLTTGQKFTNAVELSNLLAGEKKDNFLRCLVQKMMTYALGRGMEAYDRPAIDGVLQKLKKSDNKMESLIVGVVESLPFQKRRGDSRTK
jgi:hypothetical protein